MNDLDERINNILSGAAKMAWNFILKRLMHSPVFWGALVFFFLLLVEVGFLFAFFGDASTDRVVQNNALEAAQIVSSVAPPVESYNKAEENFFLPYGIPYTIQLYARDWDDNMDKEMVKNIATDLKPVFIYFEYDEPTEVWESWYDKKGNYYSSHYTVYNKRKFIKSVDTYAGVFYPIYQVFESRNEISMPEYNGKINYHRLEVVHFLAQVGVDFLTDWTRLDNAIVKYAYSNSNNPDSSSITIETYESEPGKMIYPFSGSYQVTSPFGPRIHPVYGVERFHSGVDFGTPLGTPILTVLDGVVVTVGPGGGYGNVVIIRHANNLSTVYAHLSKIYVKPGDFVKQGQIVALSGNTGVSTGPHLHFEVRENGKPVDPMPYLGGTVHYAGGTIHYVPEIERTMVMETAFSIMGEIERFRVLTVDEKPNIQNPSPPRQEVIKSDFSAPKDKYLVKIFEEAGRKCDISPTVLMAIAYVESGYRGDAIGVYYPEPNTALLGVMQLLPDVLEEYNPFKQGENVSSNVNQVSPNAGAFEYRTAVYTAANYLRSLMNYYESRGYSESEALRIALWRYNNHFSWWYADKVLSVAAQITGYMERMERN